MAVNNAKTTALAMTPNGFKKKEGVMIRFQLTV